TRAGERPVAVNHRVIANYTATGLSVDGGLALFSSEDAVVNGDGTFTSTGPVFREDAVGFRKKNSDTNENVFLPVLREGQGLAPIGPQDPAGRAGGELREYSFVRKHVTGGNE